MEHLLKSNRLILKNPQAEDERRLVDFYQRNASHLSDWETVSDLISPASAFAYRDKLQAWAVENEQGTAVRFFLFKKDDPQGTLIGICNYTQIYHGPFQACYLGYKIDRAYEGQGYMSEALRESIAYVFKDIGLHRIMANFMPTNSRSADLLSRLGFQVEGYAQNYLLINNSWEDHVLTALTLERWSSLNNPMGEE